MAEPLSAEERTRITEHSKGPHDMTQCWGCVVGTERLLAALAAVEAERDAAKFLARANADTANLNYQRIEALKAKQDRLVARYRAALAREAEEREWRAGVEAGRDRLRAALTRSDSLLSLLYYRLEHTIPWGSTGIPDRQHVQEVIGQSRAALGEADARG